jgi:hypothetical protein
MAAAPEDDEELLDAERAPPPPALLRSELTEAVDDAIADDKRELKLRDVDAVANRLSSHSEI